MKIAAIFVLSAIAVLAADPAPETGPNFNDPSRRELPYPLPPDFNECVTVIWSDSRRAERGYSVGVYLPPITDGQRAAINKGQRLNWGRYFYCDQRPT